MSFAAEMRDFYAGFRATASVAGGIRDRIDERKNTFDPTKADSGYKMFGPGVGQTTQSGKNGVKGPPAEVQKIIDSNVPEEMRPFAYSMAEKESKFNPGAVSPTGATGLFQFTSGTWTDMTGQSIGAHTDGRRDPVANTQAFVKLTERNKAYLTKVLGREPTFGELAVAHQQGPGGAAYLLTGRAPKGFDAASVRKNLAHNNVKSQGVDAASEIAAFYGFELGDMSKVASGAIPDVPTASYLPPQVPEEPTQTAGTPQKTAAADDGSGEQYASAIPEAPMNEIDYELPEGARLYQPGDLTQAPGSVMYSAEGGSVPWADETSYLRRQQSAIPTYRPAQSYGPLVDLPDVAVDTKPKRPKNPNKRGLIHSPNPQISLNKGGRDGMMPYTGPMMPVPRTGFNPSAGNKGNSGIGGGYGVNGSGNRGNGSYGANGSIGRSFYAEGGPVEDDSNEALPLGSVTPAGNPRGSNREALAIDQKREAQAQQSVSTGNVIDLGLKHLTKSLGLDRANSAVGPDPQLQDGKRKLVNGAVGPNEGPPSQKEVDDLYKIVDPNGELDQGLRTIYTMKKGVEFYLQRGDTAKAGKFAASLIQYSNLLSRRFGYEAVQAGKAGDKDGMVQYAIKAYDAVPDGLSAGVEPAEGGYNVTRKDEDGNVVDQHMLTPEQIFQMATGISQGSGYFEALMDVATPGTSAAARKEKQGKTRAGNLNKLLPDIEADLDAGEKEAWASAAETGDYDTMNGILKDVKRRHDEASKEERQSEQWRRQDERLQKSLDAIAARQEDSQAHQDEAAQTRAETAAKADEAKQTAKEEKALQDRKDLADTYNEGYDAYAPKMSAAQRRQWKKAFERAQPDVMKRIMDDITTEYGPPKADPLTGNEGDKGTPPASAIPAEPAAPAVTSEGNTPLKPAPAAILVKARAAIAKKGRDAVVGMLKANGYSDEGL